MECNRLASAWHSAVDEGPRVAIISGEPGIGKTRLADELYRWCIQQGHAAARSRCYAGQGQLAYAPVAEWLRSDAVRAGWTSLRPQQLVELARLALATVHPWDVLGAHGAGLVAGWCNRQGATYPTTFGRPDMTGTTLVDVVEGFFSLTS